MHVCMNCVCCWHMQKLYYLHEMQKLIKAILYMYMKFYNLIGQSLVL